MKLVVSGGTGFIGQELVRQLLHAGHEVVVLTRRPRPTSTPHLTFCQWDTQTVDTAWVKEIAGAQAVINLAGAGVADQRWTAHRKKIIYDSRINSTRALVDAIGHVTERPSVLINASGISYYGLKTGQVTEDSPAGDDFLARVSADWEAAAQAVEAHGSRAVQLRIGIVLGKNGGALAKMLPPFYLFLGGPLGDGQQWFPWVHRADVIGAILFALERETLQGPVNMVAPHPVRMRDFCRTLGEVLHRPSWAAVPAPILHLIFGELAEVILGGQHAIPQKLIDAGYTFRYPTLKPALQAILN
ncbi:MAG: TIGR01777 family protein [Gemmatimonadetes bacterium]|nr:MAG: TIGR01777 family protein [Gemmatimonadota bacterium]